jgi:hypothetical protein
MKKRLPSNSSLIPSLYFLTPPATVLMRPLTPRATGGSASALAEIPRRDNGAGASARARVFPDYTGQNFDEPARACLTSPPRPETSPEASR